MKDKIKTGLASFGLSGTVFHAPFIDLHTGFELRFIVERTKTLSEQAYPNARILRSFDELLGSDVELVVINTPGPTHYEFCRQALQAGKHVVIEKPMVPSLSEAEELISLARKQKCLLTVFQNRRYDGDFLTLQRIITSGELGRIVEFQSSFQRYRPQLAAVRSWRETPQPGNGITYDLCTHLSDQALVLFGKPDGVWATQAAQREASQIDDYCLMQLIYPHVKVTLRAGMLIREEAPRFALHGTGGSFVKFGLDPQEELLRSGRGKPSREPWAVESPQEWGILYTDAGRRPYPTVAGNYLYYYDAVHAALREGAPAPVSFEEMLTDIRMIEAAYESNRTGNSVKI